MFFKCLFNFFNFLLMMRAVLLENFIETVFTPMTFEICDVLLLHSCPKNLEEFPNANSRIIKI